MQSFDAIILGAGAAGLFCGWQAGLRGLRTLVIDHAPKPGEKIRISGGGRCNFTNLHTSARNFLSDNPHFAKSALARYTQHDFIALIDSHGIAWHEKTLGQLFCDGRSTQIVDMLVNGHRDAGGDLWLSSPVRELTHADGGFTLSCDHGSVTAPRLVVATGGLSIPKMGATGFGYDIAHQFGHAVITPRPALVPFTFAEPEKSRFAGLAGVSADCTATAGGTAFTEAMLFTHRGLSGPAILQASSYWSPGEPVTLRLHSANTTREHLENARKTQPRRTLGHALSPLLTTRFASAMADWNGWPVDTRMAELPGAVLDTICQTLDQWTVRPDGTEGYRTAEVTAGGVDTQALSSKTMESRHVPGLHFIGEVVDVTGWLGGYNFQWAWSSGWACAQAL